MRNLDFSSWHSVLVTLLGLALFTLISMGVRLVMMMTIQQRRERANRQINERLKTLISAYKVLGGSFTGTLAVDPRHLRDLRAPPVEVAEPDGGEQETVALAVPGTDASDRPRRIRDAVEAALADIILLGTEEQVRLAEHAARELVAGRPVHTHDLVVSLRDFIRQALDLAPIPADLTIPMKVAESVYPADLDAPQTALSAIGQGSVAATPLQMAMVAAAIANGGQLMEPYLVQTVRTADLDVVSKASPSVLSTAVSPTTATALRDMMIGVVENGTGTAAKIPGIQVAGKTGTAQTTDNSAPHAWFTAFAPADAPRVAVAVIVEHGGTLGNEATGGRVAAPIAKAVMQAVLGK